MITQFTKSDASVADARQMSSKYLGRCTELSKRLRIECDCCDTCHDDDDEGYDSLCEVEFEDGYYDACCRMREICMGKIDD